MLNKKEFYNKVLGGWLGKCAGGILGAPIEGYKCFNEIPLTDELFETTFPNDDLDLQILWLDMVYKKGPKVRHADFTEHWHNHVDFPWNEYGIATRNMKLGLDNPDTGKHNNDYWNESMGSPIRSEIWGMLCAGNPALASFYARIDSQIDHNGFSDDAEAYLAACAALAFTKNDLRQILVDGLDFISSDCLTYQMVQRVMDWYDTYSVEVVTGKIKSYYGDADFTSAPMNVAFTVLALLDSKGDFDKLIEALHFGHDSDCIVATAGAMIGIVRGADEIPELWKTRIGNHLVVSPEITGIDCPDTITSLTEKTCKVAQLFQKENAIVDFSGEEPFEVENIQPFAFRTEIVKYPDFEGNLKVVIAVHIENLSESEKSFDIHFDSSAFISANTSIFKIGVGEEGTAQVEVSLNENDSFDKTSIPYTVNVKMDDTFSFKFERGIPYYGKWLLLGPFIKDDASLAPMHPEYPDHGLPSMPSAEYMNHDMQCPEEDFLPTDLLDKLSEPSLFQQAFCTQVISPASMSIDLSKYFYGKGERTVYLYTQVESAEEIKKWLCMGSSNYMTVWVNKEQVHKTDKLKRRWPSTAFVPLNLNKGTNEVLIRIDFINDDFKFNVGIKEHKNRHPHQTQWDTEFNFSLPKVVVENEKGLIVN